MAISPASRAFCAIRSRFARSVRPPLSRWRYDKTNGVTRCPATPSARAACSAPSISGSMGAAEQKARAAELPVRPRDPSRLLDGLDACGDGRAPRGRIEQRQRVDAVAEHGDAERLEHL